MKAIWSYTLRRQQSNTDELMVVTARMDGNAMHELRRQDLA